MKTENNKKSKSPFKKFSQRFKDAKIMKQLENEIRLGKDIPKTGSKKEKIEYAQKVMQYNELATALNNKQKSNNKFVKAIKKFIRKIFGKILKLEPEPTAEEIKKQKIQDLIYQNKLQKMNYKQNNKFMR